MIVRVAHRKRFTVIADQSLRDVRLSFRATGLLAYLLTLPDGSKISGRDLCTVKKEGRDATFSALKELEDAGYLSRGRAQAPGGTWYTLCTLTELPEKRTPSPGNQDSVNQDSVFQDSKDLIPRANTNYANASLETDNPQPPLPRDELRAKLRALRLQEDTA